MDPFVRLIDAAPVSVDPFIVLLFDWKVFQTERRERHFAGYNARTRRYRVSSALVRFDPERKTGVTQSGRFYRLEGPPAGDDAVDVVFMAWCEGCGVHMVKDVTQQSLEDPGFGSQFLN